MIKLALMLPPQLATNIQRLHQSLFFTPPSGCSLEDGFEGFLFYKEKFDSLYHMCNILYGHLHPHKQNLIYLAIRFFPHSQAMIKIWNRHIENV